MEQGHGKNKLPEISKQLPRPLSPDNDIKMTGLQMEIGQFTSSSIPDFQKINDTATERRRCDRYCQLLAYGQDQVIGNGNSYSDTRLVTDYCQRGSFRNTPSVIQSSASNSLRIDVNNGFDLFDNISGTQFGSVNGIGLVSDSGVSTAVGKYAYLYGGASTTRLLVNAEL